VGRLRGQAPIKPIPISACRAGDERQERRMSERTQTDVAIVGGGIVGASAALALRRMGLGVVLLERDLCGSRSSGVNYGGVRRQGRPLSQLPLAQRAHRIWGELPELLGTDGEYIRRAISRSRAAKPTWPRWSATASAAATSTWAWR
jgi:sarcosine oxidase subunit beta